AGIDEFDAAVERHHRDAVAAGVQYPLQKGAEVGGRLARLHHAHGHGTDGASVRLGAFERRRSHVAIRLPTPHRRHRARIYGQINAWGNGRIAMRPAGGRPLAGIISPLSGPQPPPPASRCPSSPSDWGCFATAVLRSDSRYPSTAKPRD